MALILKMIFGGFIIGFAAWLSGKRPDIAGFITALPLVSIVAIAMAYNTHKDIGVSTEYARSIIFAVPVSWLFFVPFFFGEKLNMSFWAMWVLGLALLGAGYFLHQGILRIVE